MLGKNNINGKLRKIQPQKQRFSIRKFAVGAASVLIGLTFMGMSNQTVKADVAPASVQQEKANEEAGDSSDSEKVTADQTKSETPSDTISKSSTDDAAKEADTSSEVTEKTDSENKATAVTTQDPSTQNGGGKYPA